MVSQGDDRKAVGNETVKERFNVSQTFREHLIELGAKALARMHGQDPDAPRPRLIDGDMRKCDPDPPPTWHIYREAAACVVDAVFDRPQLSRQATDQENAEARRQLREGNAAAKAAWLADGLKTSMPTR
jgi:hypothetical protein